MTTPGALGRHHQARAAVTTLLAELAAPALQPVWTAVRRRLERNGLQPVGRVEVQLDEHGADLLGGVLGRRLDPGRSRLPLDVLDAQLIVYPAARRLVDVVTALTGPLRDRTAKRAAARSARTAVEEELTEALAAAGLAGAPWVAPWLAGLRSSGLLTTATGGQCAPAVQAIELALAGGPPRTLGELAVQITGTAHGLDPGSRTAALVVRGLAAALDVPVPVTGAERAALWARVDVSVDEVSGTVLAWAFRPPGPGPWARMLRARADLGLVTHLTVQELRAADPAPWAEAGTVVSVCENPQVVQVSAGRGAHRPLLCLLGNPSAAGTLLVRRLVADGVDVRYHGDFDWPGMAIAGRVLALGARPWRLGAGDYRAALPAGTTN